VTRLIIVPITLGTHRESFDIFLGGDLHYNDPGCDVDSFLRWCDAVVANWENGRKTYNALMGDYCTVFPSGDRRRLPKSEMGDPLRLYSQVRDWIRPVARTNVCTLTGNHDEDWWKSENIDFVSWMCAELGLNYGNYEAIVRFKVEREGDNTGARNIDLVLWHGAGGGRTRGGTINAAARPLEMHRTADIIAVGHSHRLGKINEQYVVPDESIMDVRSVNQFIVMTGGYQKGYLPDKSTYISKLMLPPITIGGVKLVVQPFKQVSTKDVLDVTLHQIY